MKEHRGFCIWLLSALCVGLEGLGACPPGAIVINRHGVGGVRPGEGPVRLNEGIFCIAENIDLAVTWGAGNGTYFVLGSNVALIGERPTIVVTTAPGEDRAIIVESLDVVIRFLQLKATENSARGIVVGPHAANVVISEVVLDNTSGGFSEAFIEVQGYKAVQVDGCELRVGSPAKTGILVAGGYEHQVTRNWIDVSDTASYEFCPIEVRGLAHVVSGNRVTRQSAPGGTEEGLSVQILATSAETAVDNNHIVFQAPVPLGSVGILVRGPAGQVTNNIVANLGGFQGAGSLNGIWIEQTAVYTRVEGNQVIGAGYVAATEQHHRGNAAFIEAPHVTIRDNPYLETTHAVPGKQLHEIDSDNAAGVAVAATARSVRILGNAKIVAATSGIVVRSVDALIRENVVVFAAQGKDATEVLSGADGSGPLHPYCGILVTGVLARVFQNEIRGVGQDQPSATPAAFGGHGICLVESAASTVRENRILGPIGDGIRIADSINPSVEENTILDPGGSGIRIEGTGSMNAWINRNTVLRAWVHGISINGGANHLCIDNQVIECGFAGVFVNGGVRLIGNILADNTLGIVVEEQGAAQILSCNRISGGSVGLFVSPVADARRQVITGNSIMTSIRVWNASTRMLQISNNWWGDPQGPPEGSIAGLVEVVDSVDSDVCKPAPPPTP